MVCSRTGDSVRKIIFAHQGKCGGSTLVAALKRSYGTENVYHDTDQNKRWAKHATYRFLAECFESRLWYRNLASYRVIYGHFRPQKYRKAFPDALFITFYRNPVQQLVSLYYYWLRSPVTGILHPNRKVLLERKLSLEEFAVLVTHPKRIEKIVSDFRLEYFHCIGITEAFDTSLKLLQKKFLPDLLLEVDTQNTNPAKTVGQNYEIDSDTYEHIRHRVAPRMKLYEAAVERFRKECLEEEIECPI